MGKEVEMNTNSEAVEAPKAADNVAEEQSNKLLEMYGGKLKSIQELDRATINAKILDALVGFPLNFLDEVSAGVNELTKVLDAANGAKNKRKVSLKLKNAVDIRDNIIKFAYRLEGLRQATLEDIQPDFNFGAEATKANLNEKENEDGNLEK